MKVLFSTHKTRWVKKVNASTSFRDLLTEKSDKTSGIIASLAVARSNLINNYRYADKFLELAKTAFAKQDYEEAFNHAQTALSINKYHPAVNFIVAEYYFFVQRNYIEAEKFYREELKSITPTEGAYYQLGNIAYMNKNYAEA